MLLSRVNFELFDVVVAKGSNDNIALKALEGDDYIPFYVEVARREGMGEEFAASIAQQVEKVLAEDFEE